MVKEAPFRLEEEAVLIQRLWREGQESFVPLCVAAAITFHQAHGSTRAIRTRNDFDDALNIAASALARLVPIYRSDRERTAIDIDLTRQAFVHGATRLRSGDGTEIADLCVKRGDVLHASAIIQARGLPFSFVGRAMSPRQNHLLAALPAADYQRIASQMELVPLALGEPLYEPEKPLRWAHFPVSGVVSRLYVTSDGESTEIAVIGRDGVVGVAILLGARMTSDRAVVQVAGHAYRVAADALLDEFGRGGELHARTLRYVQALMTQMAQTAVCNRHHSIEQQLCRWLLLTLDRIEGNDVLMTHELISQMLGVRRPGISEAARRLHEAGILAVSRGQIRVMDRKRLEARACECYSVVKRETARIAGEQSFTPS